MSGGSYNYLCYACPEDIGSKSEDIRNMADRINELGYSDIAIKTKAISGAIKEFEEKMQKEIDSLYDVWRAVEWLDSGDYGLEQALETLEEFRNKSI